MPVFTLARPALVRGSEANVRSVNAGYGPRTTSRLQIALFARVGGQGVFNGIPPLANLSLHPSVSFIIAVLIGNLLDFSKIPLAHYVFI